MEPSVLMVGVQEGRLCQRKTLWDLQLSNGQEQTLLSNRGRTHHQCHSFIVLHLLAATDLLIFFLVDVQGFWKLLIEHTRMVCVVHALLINAFVFKELVELHNPWSHKSGFFFWCILVCFFVQLHTNEIVPFENDTHPTWQAFKVVLGQIRVPPVPVDKLDTQVQPQHTTLIPLVLFGAKFEVLDKLRFNQSKLALSSTFHVQLLQLSRIELLEKLLH